MIGKIVRFSSGKKGFPLDKIWDLQLAGAGRTGLAGQAGLAGRSRPEPNMLAGLAGPARPEPAAPPRNMCLILFKRASPNGLRLQPYAEALFRPFLDAHLQNVTPIQRNASVSKTCLKAVRV